jgi:hypothetical protein
MIVQYKWLSRFECNQDFEWQWFKYLAFDCLFVSNTTEMETVRLFPLA